MQWSSGFPELLRADEFDMRYNNKIHIKRNSSCILQYDNPPKHLFTG